MSVDRSGPESSTLRQLGCQYTRRRPVGIQNLPAEILHSILVFSRSSALPVTCRFFRQTLQNSGVLVKAEYILGRWCDHLIEYVVAHPCRAKHKACRSLTSRLAGPKRNYDLAHIEITDCLANLIETNHLDIITFGAELGITTAEVLDRVVDLATASLSHSLSSRVLPALVRVPVGTSRPNLNARFVRHSRLRLVPQLPKRLFRRIDRTISDGEISSSTTVTAPSAGGDSRRRKRRNLSWSNTAQAPGVATNGYSWISKLLLCLANGPRHTDATRSGKRKRDESLYDSDENLNGRVGPVPSPEDLELILALLIQYGADASSHQGYPLAMAVHRRAYALARLLLLFGADPNCKEGLAAQIAIRNGSCHILHLLVTGTRLDADAQESFPILATVPLMEVGSITLKLNRTHLRLAIQCRQWHLVDYIWHERDVAPDISCLRLIEKLGHRSTSPFRSEATQCCESG